MHSAESWNNYVNKENDLTRKALNPKLDTEYTDRKKKQQITNSLKTKLPGCYVKKNHVSHSLNPDFHAIWHVYTLEFTFTSHYLF